MWIFGYGSLVWKADFPFVQKLVGFIKGYQRRFWQLSIDHRGTRDSPGRVVTLVPTTEHNAQVWGVAYEISQSEERNVIQHLDYREKNGYRREMVKFYPACGEPFDLEIYVGTEDNEWFGGELDIESIASQVASARGPSGHNDEYVFRLAAAMRLLAPGVHDQHLFALEQALNTLQQQQQQQQQQDTPPNTNTNTQH